jgi:hypothetical protein
MKLGGPREGCGKFRFPPGFDPRNVKPVSGRYTDYPVPARFNRNIKAKLLVFSFMQEHEVSFGRLSFLLPKHNEQYNSVCVCACIA